MKNTENWIVNESDWTTEHPEGLSANDLIEVVYLNGGKETGLAKTWQSAWNSSHRFSFTIKEYRVLKKSNVLTRFFSFISDNQNDAFVILSILLLSTSLTTSLFACLFYLISQVSDWFVLLIPAIPLAYLIHRFRKE